MEALPLIAAAGLAFLFLSNKNSSSSNSNSDSKKATDKVVISGNIELITCKLNQFKDNFGNCRDYWIEGETDLAVSQALDNELLKYKNKSWDEMCADKKVDNGTISFLPNANSLAIVKSIITTLWNPLITKKELPPKDNSPEYIKVVWKKVTAIYFNKVCGLV